MIKKRLHQFLLTRHDRLHTSKPRPIQKEWVSIGKGVEMMEFPSKRAHQHRDTDSRAKWHCGTAMKEVVVATRFANDGVVRLQRSDTFICSVCHCRIPMKATNSMRKSSFLSTLVFIFSEENLLG